MYASLGCGTPSAKCTAGLSIFGYFFVSFGVTLGPAETPFAKAPLLSVPDFGWVLILGGQEAKNAHKEIPT